MRNLGRSPGKTSFVGLAIALALAALGGGCAKSPADLLKKLKETLDGMALAKKCAPEAYRAAMKMYEEAIELDKKKSYKEAQTAAEAAEKLAAKAKSEAEANKGKCEAIADADKKDPLGGAGAPDGGTPAAPTAESNDKLPGGPGGDVPPDTPILETVTVYFDFNSYSVKPEDLTKLQSFAASIKGKPASIEVEGHCDVRGSVEYNLSLGERRARAVREQLVAQGAAEKTITIISYGSERPAVDGAGEDAHAKNRRAVVNRR